MDLDNSNEPWQRDFPMEESYNAADGRVIMFEIIGGETPAGFFVQAEETEKSKKNRLGYTFVNFSPVNPYLALGEIRDKIRKRLSTKYIEYTEGFSQLTHDKLAGMIDYSTDDEEVVLQVDGDKITMEDLKRILSGYEGFEITIEIK